MAKIMEHDFNEKEDVLPLSINDEMSLPEVEIMLAQTVNYSDYLAEERKKARLDAKDKKAAYKHWRLVHLQKATGKDADTRKAEADEAASVFLDEYETAEIEADYIKDLLNGNHDKTEALRSILASKRAVFEKTYSQP